MALAYKQKQIEKDEAKEKTLCLMRSNGCGKRWLALLGLREEGGRLAI